MKKEIKVPSMGESITEATIGTIMKPSGSKVALDDEVLELETDKVNQVLYSPLDGVVTLEVSADDVVKIGQVIGHVDSEGKGEEPAKPAKAEEKPKKEEPAPAKKEEATKPQAGVRLSREAYLEEFKKPAEKAIEAPKKAAFEVSGIQEPYVATKRETRRKMSKIRRVIASRLVEAQQTTAMLTTFNEVDLSRVIETRTKYQEQFQKEHGVKLGFMSFFVKATVSALEAFPDLNSYIEGDEIVHREYYDVGIAVATERGLIVPVIRNCDHLSFAQIEAALETFAKKARDSTLTVDDLQGGGFTITNGGVYGSLLSTPILNPPQSGILGMHKIQKRPVAVDDAIVIRPMMYLALSYDHRIVDGKEAVSFLVHIKSCLEDPARMLLKV